MSYESVKDAAARLGVTPRAVQKWASNGMLPGSIKQGRDWFIPSDVVKTAVGEETKKVKSPDRMPLPLLRGAFEPGKAMGYIESLADEDDRNIALAEYYYYTGQGERANELAEPYLYSSDFVLRYSAGIICTFANAFKGYSRHGKFVAELVSSQLEQGLADNITPENRALWVVTAYMGKALLRLDVPEVPPLEKYLRYLPNGIRLFGCYILAFIALREDANERALAICDTAIAMCNSRYPVALIFAETIAASALVNLKRNDEAKERFSEIWSMVSADGFVKILGIHHKRLSGLIEVTLKRDFSDEYKRLAKIAEETDAGLRKFEKSSHDYFAHTLTANEIIVSMLYNKNWSTKEIAAHLELSESTIKNYVRIIYEKLGVSKKSELRAFFNE